MHLIQRIADVLREYRLAALLRALQAAQHCDDHDTALKLWCRYAAEHKRRSPEQVARMARAKGPRL